MQLIGDVDALKSSLAQSEPPIGLDPALTALWWSAKTQFDTAELGKDLYKAMGQPFNGGGSLAMLTAERPDYGAPELSPRWCWGVAHSMTQTTDYGFRVQATRDPDDPSTWGDPRLNWVHGFVHRLEQDDRNAEGWYGRGFKPLGSGLAVSSGKDFEQEWEAIAKDLLASHRISPRSFMCGLSTEAAAIIGDLEVSPLPIALDPENHSFTYTGETYDKLIAVAEVLPGAIADESHAVAFVAGLYIWHGLWDEAHALLLGAGSAHHPKIPGPCSTRSYLHAILHRIEGVMDNEGGTPGYRNSEYWYRNAGDEHPMLPTLGAIARSLGDDVGACTRPDGRFDPFAFIQLVETNFAAGYGTGGSEELKEACLAMQDAELGLMLAYCQAVAQGEERVSDASRGTARL
jgi:hypothetical protein